MEEKKEKGYTDTYSTKSLDRSYAAMLGHQRRIESGVDTRGYGTKLEAGFAMMGGNNEE